MVRQSTQLVSQILRQNRNAEPGSTKILKTKNTSIILGDHFDKFIPTQLHDGRVLLLSGYKNRSIT